MAINQPRSLENQSGSNSRLTFICLTLILLIGAVVRLHALTKDSYVLDEIWTMEIATGRGSLHLNLPLDRLITPPPEFLALDDAPTVWHIWTHMEVTYPPLFSILQRCWEELFGISDASGRILSVVASLIAVALLFDIVRLQAGLGMAVGAALLMALASPQIDHARLARGYSLLIAVALAAADVLVRIQLFGKSPRRLFLLTLAVLATLLTHYFCIGVIFGLLVYSLCAIPGHRQKLFTAFVVAGVIFAIIWGPWMWQQRHLFSVDDVSADFLNDQTPNHLRITIARALMIPGSMLFPLSEKGFTGILAMVGGAALCFGPLLRPLWRKNKFLGMWALWLIGAVGVPMLLDLVHGTKHLRFPRYTILAGPAVYALVPMLLADLCKRKPLAHLAIALVIAACALHVQDVYDDPETDLREPVRDLIAQPGPADVFFSAAPPERAVIAEARLLMYTRYLGDLHCPVAVLTRRADPEIINVARHARYIFLLTPRDDCRDYLPDARIIRSRRYPGLGYVFTMDLKPATASGD